MTGLRRVKTCSCPDPSCFLPPPLPISLLFLILTLTLSPSILLLIFRSCQHDLSVLLYTSVLLLRETNNVSCAFWRSTVAVAVKNVC